MEWLGNNQPLLVWVGTGSAIVFIASLLSLPWLVAKIPEDYFVPKKAPTNPMENSEASTSTAGLNRQKPTGLWVNSGGAPNVVFARPGDFNHGHRIIIDRLPGEISH